MTEPHDTGPKRPAPPYLVSPQEEAVVDGAAVTFTWEPVAGATGYRLEVASDAAFETVVYQATTEAVSHAAAGAFAPDGTTYYWRVFAQNEHGESLGENIESFLSQTQEAAALHLERPDHGERLGPVTELITGGSEDMLHLRSRQGQPSPVEVPVAEGATHEAFYAAEDLAGVQREGIEAGQIVGFIFLLIVLLGFVVWGSISWFESVADQARADAASALDYPELRQVELAATQLLSRYDVVDAARGVYRIPVDRAIVLMVEEARQAPPANYSQELQLVPGN